MNVEHTESGLLDRFFAFEDKLILALAYFCGLLFILYSFYVAFEVIGRHFLGVFTGITDEIGGYVLALGGSLGLAYTLRAEGHVRIDVIFGFIPDRFRPWFDSISMAVMVVFGFVATRYILEMAIESYEINATGHSLIQMPQWVIQGMVTAGYALLTFAAFTSFVRKILEGFVAYRTLK